MSGPLKYSDGMLVTGREHTLTMHQKPLLTTTSWDRSVSHATSNGMSIQNELMLEEDDGVVELDESYAPLIVN